MMNFQKRLLQTRFNTWLTNPVYTGPGTNTAMRQTVLYEFTLDLISFLKRFGYSITRSPVDVARDLARFIFKANFVPHHNFKVNRNNDERPEDYDMYLHTIGFEEWNRFFQDYADVDDFDCSESNGRFITYSIPCFAWHTININSSEATRLLDEQLSDSESDDGTRIRRQKNRGYDPYLTDQQNNVSKFNRWD